jgi:hypothetical protein
MNRIGLLLFDLENRMAGPYLAAMHRILHTLYSTAVV